ncbi:unnamed protein product [Paramecium primaurelia]|uniref:Peptidyl-prolyl cis-trans isomerase n=4 Tax=Paramecium TaxID=5884 RepID=A0CUD4_PARTE|nr:uncharacterized protein GSPATT00010601001 [Paramecium tetraurelia]CAD8068443.1 unnamed protein product [Paramecium primaurelia]CAD8165867.1 unnamed protein product [Paramecium octaurelia]CAD8167496.1 unnamed protein product [Paramecium pentaurelia]CAK74401.1 unnamed protein product [Paramecium tetraurelia]|eukprot:XP_001441798.1 hypothetical protein (macronuclear) [Paramecium tetraurelia strain d4-2]
MSVTLHTSHGDIKLELFCELTPKTCKNFLALCAKKFYDNTIFHRNIPGFIIQGGDPTGTGKGGECIYGKYFEDEIVPEIKHDRRGIVSMANAGKDTNQSQFFITYSKQNHLNGLYTAFGKVIYGWEALDLMEKETVDNNYKALNEIKIFKTTIHANPIADIEQF